jgi:hypothetical protein
MSSSSEDEKNKKKTEKEKERKTYQYSIIKEYDDYETAEQEIQNLEIKGFKMSYKALNKQKDLESSRSFKSDSESRSTDTSEYLERVTGKRRCRSADETLDDEDINAFDGSIDNYEDNLSVIQNFAIENVINNNKASAHVAVADDIVADDNVDDNNDNNDDDNVADNNDDDNVADNNDDDDDIIIEKFAGGKLGKTVKVDKTRMSKGFYQYAREKIKIKKEKELILESESTGRLTRSKKK